MTKFRLETKQITDWASFHCTCEEAFGFPDYYGRNMNAWIDCMSDLAIGENLQVELTDTENFNSRLPEIFDAVVECTAFLNKHLLLHAKKLE